jgi:hypothetical protein
MEQNLYITKFAKNKIFFNITYYYFELKIYRNKHPQNMLRWPLPLRQVIIIVRELVGRVRNVVLMNEYLDLENPGGSGFWVEGYMSQVREMGKLVYEQPGNEVGGSCHSKEGSK